MKRTIATLATVATMAVGFSAPTAFAMEDELNMLTGAVYHSLRSMGLPTDDINNLTLSEVAQIKNLIDEDGMGNTQKIKLILSRAE